MTAPEQTDAKPFGTGDRFTIAPAYSDVARFDHRNTTGRKRDGWVLRDTWTGSSYRLDTKKEAAARIELSLSDEAQLDWSRVAGWSCSALSRPGALLPIGLVEVDAVDSTGRRLRRLVTVGAGGHSCDPVVARQNIARYLTMLGHADLPEVVA